MLTSISKNQTEVPFAIFLNYDEILPPGLDIEFSDAKKLRNNYEKKFHNLISTISKKLIDFKKIYFVITSREEIKDKIFEKFKERFFTHLPKNISCEKTDSKLQKTDLSTYCSHKDHRKDKSNIQCIPSKIQKWMENHFDVKNYLIINSSQRHVNNIFENGPLVNIDGFDELSKLEKCIEKIEIEDCKDKFSSLVIDNLKILQSTNLNVSSYISDFRLTNFNYLILVKEYFKTLSLNAKDLLKGSDNCVERSIGLENVASFMLSKFLKAFKLKYGPILYDELFQPYLMNYEDVQEKFTIKLKNSGFIIKNRIFFMDNCCSLVQKTIINSSLVNSLKEKTPINESSSNSIDIQFYCKKFPGLNSEKNKKINDACQMINNLLQELKFPNSTLSLILRRD